MLVLAESFSLSSLSTQSKGYKPNLKPDSIDNSDDDSGGQGGQGARGGEGEKNMFQCLCPSGLNDMLNNFDVFLP